MDWNVFFSLFLPCVDHLVCQFSFLSPGKNVYCVFKASTYITIDRSTQLTSKWQTQSKHGGMQKKYIFGPEHVNNNINRLHQVNHLPSKLHSVTD